MYVSNFQIKDDLSVYMQAQNASTFNPIYKIDKNGPLIIATDLKKKTLS